jgi:hypothetical protein
MTSDGRVQHKQQDYDCVHAGELVRISSRLVYPVGFLSESPPRMLSKNCDHYTNCHLLDRHACPMAVAHFAERPH